MVTFENLKIRDSKIRDLKIKPGTAVCRDAFSNFQIFKSSNIRRCAMLLFFVLLGSNVNAQVYPVYGDEIKVYISGYADHAMEPFLSPDGNTLFFNNLNTGDSTRLHYATRVDDTTFTYMGLVTGANEPNNPQLNAVASLDTTGNFVWVSVRDWPNTMDNLHRGDYSNGTVTNVNRVHGNFYVYQPGYIVMDAAVTYDGSELYYCNAFFDTCVVPCAASLGIASKVNDSTFNTIAASQNILQHVNDTDYCVYAPQLSTDGLELYFTRYLIGGLSTEICVSVRPTVADTFSSPLVLISDFPNVPEAATVNTAGTLMYYHKKTNGTYTIYLRYRDLTGIEENENRSLRVFPNPANDVLYIEGATQQDEITIMNSLGQPVLVQTGSMSVNTCSLCEGIYFVNVLRAGVIYTTTFTICR
jgi:hypothetical protein